jgi:hypothetical protein
LADTKLGEEIFEGRQNALRYVAKHPRQHIGNRRRPLRILWGTLVWFREASNIPSSSWTLFEESTRLDGVFFLHVYDPGSYLFSHIVRI